MVEKITHYSQGLKRIAFEYFTMNCDPAGGVNVYGWGTYGPGVLEGQAMKKYLAYFETGKLAQAVYGEDMEFSSRMTEPGNTFNHLPDEGDGW